MRGGGRPSIPVLEDAAAIAVAGIRGGGSVRADSADSTEADASTFGSFPVDSRGTSSYTWDAPRGRGGRPALAQSRVPTKRRRPMNRFHHTPTATPSGH